MQLMTPVDSAMHFPLSKEGEKFKAENSSRFLEILNILCSTPTPRILSFISGAAESTIPVEGEEDLFKELLNVVLKARHKWQDEDIVDAVDAYTRSKKPLYNRPQIKVCNKCGADMTEQFALHLTTDALLNKEIIMCQCPSCATWNYFKAVVGGIDNE